MKTRFYLLSAAVLMLTFNAPSVANAHENVNGSKVFVESKTNDFANSSASSSKPQIAFEKTTIDMGVFSMDDPVQQCVFKFTNIGKKPLIINYVHASCGCTVPEYPKDPISPGATGEIKVTYNGTGKLPGHFKKNIQVFTNGKPEMARIFIQGEMTDVPVTKK